MSEFRYIKLDLEEADVKGREFRKEFISLQEEYKKLHSLSDDESKAKKTEIISKLELLKATQNSLFGQKEVLKFVMDFIKTATSSEMRTYTKVYDLVDDFDDTTGDYLALPEDRWVWLKDQLDIKIKYDMEYNNELHNPVPVFPPALRRGLSELIDKIKDAPRSKPEELKLVEGGQDAAS